MSFTIFMQVFFNIIVLTSIFVIFARLRRPAKDDPRLSKGLQLLSSKIAVLEDLNDRTESQVQQMLTLLDQKSRELQHKITTAENQVHQIRQSMNQSLEVAQIFQDKIPHSEVIERQTSMKYIRAARMAHQGFSVEEIMREVDLPRGEIEFISKVNREQLSFREEDLPAWAKEPEAHQPVAEQSVVTTLQLESPAQPAPSVPPALTPEAAALVERLNKLQFEMKSLDMELAARQPLPDESQQLADLGQQFRQAVTTPFEASAAPLSVRSSLPHPAPTYQTEVVSPEAALQAARSAATQLKMGEKKTAERPTAQGQIGRPQPAIKRVEFPRL